MGNCCNIAITLIDLNVLYFDDTGYLPPNAALAGVFEVLRVTLLPMKTLLGRD
jgi:hypothetical protein